MTISEFSQKIKEEIQKLVPQHRVEVSSIWKNNGICETAVSIIEGGKNISPTIYLEEFYKRFSEGESLRGLAKSIVALNEEYKLNASINVDFFVDYSKARKNIVYKLINKEKNEKMLERVPYMEYMDLALVFYYLVQDEKIGNATILIHDSHLKMWQVTKTDIYKEACVNTPKLLPAAITGMKEVIEQMLGEKVFQDEEEGEDIPMYVMTNPMRMNGAATMLYPNVVKNFANAIGKNVYIIPSSIHEVILVPQTGTEGVRLNDMVREVNEMQVDPKEVLADHVYFYDRQEETMTSCVREEIRYC